MNELRSISYATFLIDIALQVISSDLMFLINKFV